MRLLKNIFVFSFILLLCGDLYAGTASSKLSALSESLIKGYEAKAGAAKATLAAFPFSCEGKLRKQRVGFGVSELMSHRFVASQDFTVVERGEIGKLLNEQKLQSSGVTDSDTAVRLGHMLGAGVLLLGNINKVDGVYQVNARLVNVESGEVLASGYTELPVDAFNDDAGVYLNLVPQEQTLGIYGVLNYRHNANNAPAFVDTVPNVQTTYQPRDFTSFMAGGGLLYRPHKNLQINAELTTTKVGEYEYMVKTSSAYWSGYGYTLENKLPLSLTAVSLSASYVRNITGKFSCLGGAGLQYMLGTVENAKNPPPLLFVKAGVEYKPQSRVGFGLNMKYDLKPIRFLFENGDNVLLKMNPLSFETVLAMYF